MSGSSKKRHSKWDNNGSETLPEEFYDKTPAQRPREPFSPGRGSRRHDSHNRESTMTLDMEGIYTRVSPKLDERRPLNSSRSPRNGLGRSQRISTSRSRSRSRSPAHHCRRGHIANDRSRSRSGASGQICRNFAAGRCRRGHSCHFLHQDAQSYDNWRPLECGQRDECEDRHRRTKLSRNSHDHIKDNAIRAEKSAHICNDFLKGMGRRGDTCKYVHHVESVDEFEKGPVEEIYRKRDHQHRSRDVRDTSPGHDRRSRSTNFDHDRRSKDTFLDRERRSRDTYPDHDDRSKEPYSDHDHRSRESYPDHDHRRRDMSSDRNYDGDLPMRGEILCKYFASGNCRNGSRCRFSHKVKEVFSSERAQEDKSDADHKLEGHRMWDGPKWGDAITVSNIPTVPGWEDDKNETEEMKILKVLDEGRGPDTKYEGDRVWDDPSGSDATPGPNVQQVHDWADERNQISEAAKDMTEAQTVDDTWGHDILIKSTWDPVAIIVDKSQIQEYQDKEDPLQWKTENNIPIMGLSTSIGVDNFSGNMEISPRDIKQHTMFNPTPQIPSISNISFAAVQQGMDDKASSFEIHYHDNSFVPQNVSHKDNAPILHPGARTNVVGPGDRDVSSIIHNQATTVPHGQGIFQPDENANPVPNLSPPRQSQPSLSHPLQGEGMQEVSHNPSSILEALEDRAVDVPHVGNFASSAPVQSGSTAHSTVSNEQLAQLSHLTASLAQLLENRQQLSQLSSAISPHGMPNLPDLEAPVPLMSGAMVQSNQAFKVLKQYDPANNSIEPNIPNFGDKLSSSVEQKSAISEIHELNISIEQEHIEVLKDEEHGKETKGLKGPEIGPSQDVGLQDGADDGIKLKDAKGIRPFKFALAEFVKELLKPFWKNGQVSKEAYKTIVKKAVDKVMETLGTQIPQTKEKIDMYLSCSKAKIDKLVQAYVGKHQKC